MYKYTIKRPSSCVMPCAKDHMEHMADFRVTKKLCTDTSGRIADALKANAMDIDPEVCAEYLAAVQMGDDVRTVELLREPVLQVHLERFEALLRDGASFEELTEKEDDLAKMLGLQLVCVCQTCHGEHNTDGDCHGDCHDCCNGDERAMCTKCMVCLESGDPAEWRCSCEDAYLWRTHCLLRKAGMPGRSKYHPKEAYDPSDQDDEMMCDPDA